MVSSMAFMFDVFSLSFVFVSITTCSAATFAASAKPCAVSAAALAV